MKRKTKLTGKINVVFLTLFCVFFTHWAFAQGSCDCTEYIYLNDETLDVVHKFKINADGSVTEVGAPWLSGIQAPHGIASDNNGNLYIAETVSGQFIWKLSAEGEVIDEMFIDKQQDGTPSYQTYNMGSRNGILYAFDPNDGRNEVIAYELCTGREIGRVGIGNTVSTTTAPIAWGFYIDDDNWYVSARDQNFGTPGEITTGSLDTTAFTDPATTSGTVAITLTAGSAMGVTRDTDGNYYVITQQGIDGAAPNPRIRKYAPDGTELAVINDNTNNGTNGQTANGTAGWWGARGIVYSESSGYLYVSSKENCITVFDTDLNELSTLNIANPLNGDPKGLGIIEECCPTNNNITIDLPLDCDFPLDSTISLQELLACNGVIAEGSWSPAATNTGLTFNDCNSSVSFDAPTACGTFLLETDGTGNSQCGAFRIEINISLNGITAPEIGANQDVCDDTEPAALTITTAAVGAPGFTYQWLSSTESDTTGFAPVAGATMESYSPTTASLNGVDTTWFRLEVTSNDDACLPGACQDTSNAVFVALFENPEIVLPANPTACSTAPIDLLTGVSVSPTGTAANWMSSGDGTFLDAAGAEISTGPFAFGTAVQYVPGSQDIANGAVMLTLVTEDPDGPCTGANATLTAMILKVDCGTFPWGEE